MIKALLEEYGLEIDDVRYYLSYEKAVSLLTYKDDPEALALKIWKGSLADDLYDMEEKYLQSLEENLSRRHADESAIREQLSEAAALKTKRRNYRASSPASANP